MVLGLRFVWIYLFGQTSELHVQSLILAAILLLAGFQMVLTGVVADLIGTNRALLEDMAARVKEMEMRAREGGDAKPSGRPPGGDRP